MSPKAMLWSTCNSTLRSTAWYFAELTSSSLPSVFFFFIYHCLNLAFASIDVVTTALQICGAALIGVSESRRADGKEPPISTESANNILLAGLAIQVSPRETKEGLLLEGHSHFQIYISILTFDP